MYVCIKTYVCFTVFGQAGHAGPGVWLALLCMARLAQKTVNRGPPLLGRGGVDTICTGFGRPRRQLHRVYAVSFGGPVCCVVWSRISRVRLEHMINSYLRDVSIYLKEKLVLISAPKSTVTLFNPDKHQFQTHPDITLEGHTYTTGAQS